MKRALVILAAALSACGGPSLTAEEARGAMPGTEQAQLGAPHGGAALTASGAVSAYGTASLASDSIDLAAAVNGGIAWTLGVVEFVVSLPPTRCAGDTCTWGPGSGALEVNDWQLDVTKKAEHDYTWALKGRSKVDASAPWITLVSGEAFTTGVRHVGHGTLLVDLESAKGLARKTTDPDPQSGTISASYDNTSGREVAVEFLGTDDASGDGTKVNAAYQFASSATGGDLQVATRNLSTQARFQLHTRWTAVGAGRADATYEQGGGLVSRSQCWDGAATLFALSYQITAPAAAGNGDVGSETSCVFAPAAPPTIVAP